MLSRRTNVNLVFISGLTILLVFIAEIQSGPSVKSSKQNRSTFLPGIEVVQTGVDGTTLRFGLANLDVDDVYIDGKLRQKLEFGES